MASSRRSPLAPLRSILNAGATRARKVIGTPRAGYTATTASAESLLSESFVRRLERLSLLTRGVIAEGVAGDHRSRRYAASAEFADFRQYVPGDDFRRIDWNAYARLDGLFLKLTEAKEDIAVHLLVDSSLSMHWGTPDKLGFARRLAAAIGYLSLSRYDGVTGACFAEKLYDRLPLLRGRAQAMRLLSYLDSAPVGTATQLERTMAQYCASSPRRGIAFVISDLLAEDNWQKALLRLLRERMEVVVIHILAPQELHPDLDGEVELVDVETGDIVEMVVGDQARQRYEQRTAAWCEEVEDFCHRSEIGYLCLDTTLELEDIFLNKMRRRRVVR
ncbi:MAG TPA: DUF58 domain-containing protein [Chloroflexota bacterium]|nr:DUF58 domain-containing protein [Chloroflexota bacterium]